MLLFYQFHTVFITNVIKPTTESIIKSPPKKPTIHLNIFAFPAIIK